MKTKLVLAVLAVLMNFFAFVTINAQEENGNLVRPNLPTATNTSSGKDTTVVPPPPVNNTGKQTLPYIPPLSLSSKKVDTINYSDWFYVPSKIELWGYGVTFSSQNLIGSFGGASFALRQQTSPDEPYYGVKVFVGSGNFKYTDPKFYSMDGVNNYQTIGKTQQLRGELSWGLYNVDENIVSTTGGVGIERINNNSSDINKASFKEQYTNLFFEASWDMRRDPRSKTFNRLKANLAYFYPISFLNEMTSQDGKKSLVDYVGMKRFEAGGEISLINVVLTKKISTVFSLEVNYTHLSDGLSMGFSRGVKDIYGFKAIISIFNKYSEIVRGFYEQKYDPSEMGRYMSYTGVSADGVQILKLFLPNMLRNF